MTITPTEAGEKFASGWLAAKPRAITKFTAVASGLAQKAINRRAAALTAVTTAFAANGAWVNGLQPYVGTSAIGDAFTQKVNAITDIPQVTKTKISDSVAKKQHFASILDDVLDIYKAATSGEVGVPSGISDAFLKSMLIQGINDQEGNLTRTSTAQQIYDATDSYMSTAGWPTIT